MSCELFFLCICIWLLTKFTRSKAFILLYNFHCIYSQCIWTCWVKFLSLPSTSTHSLFFSLSFTIIHVCIDISKNVQHWVLASSDSDSTKPNKLIDEFPNREMKSQIRHNSGNPTPLRTTELSSAEHSFL